MVYQCSEPSNIKDLVYDLVNKQYKLSIVPEKIMYMHNGIKYYYVEVEGIEDSKLIVNAYGTEAEYLFREVHKCFICEK